MTIKLIKICRRMIVDYSSTTQFNTAVQLVASLPKNGCFQPSTYLKLQLYAYFKQATLGPCNEKKPGFWDPVKLAKWKAWNSLSDMPTEDAMRNYVNTLRQVVETMEYTLEVENFLGQLNGCLSEMEDATRCDFAQCQNYSSSAPTNGYLNKSLNLNDTNDVSLDSDCRNVNQLILKRQLVACKSDTNSSNSCLTDDDAYADACDEQTMDRHSGSSFVAVERDRKLIDKIATSDIQTNSGQQNSTELSHIHSNHAHKPIVDADLIKTDNCSASKKNINENGSASVPYDRYNACTFAENWPNPTLLPVALQSSELHSTKSSGANFGVFCRLDDTNLLSAKDGAPLESADCIEKADPVDRAALVHYGRMLSQISDELRPETPTKSAVHDAQSAVCDSGGFLYVPSYYLNQAFDRISHIFEKRSADEHHFTKFVASSTFNENSKEKAFECPNCFSLWAKSSHCNRQMKREQKTLFKLSKTERRALRHWRPRLFESSTMKASEKTHGEISDAHRADVETKAGFSGDDQIDGNASLSAPLTSVIPTTSQQRHSDSLKKSSSSSESTSHDDSTQSSVEWDPQVGCVLLRMHGELRRLGRQMDFVQEILLAQQQLIRNSLHFTRTSWKSFILLALWPVVVNLVIRFLWRRPLRKYLRDARN